MSRLRAMASASRSIAAQWPLSTWREVAWGATGATRAGGNPLTCATFNILADQYAEGGFHAYCPPEILAWEHRRPRLLSQILAFDADVICLQEVERPFFEEDLKPMMREKGYRGWFQPRRQRMARRLGSSGGIAPEEGVALLVRSTRLQADAVVRVRLADKVPTTRLGLSQFWQQVADKEDGAVLALLTDRQSGRQFVAGATHLFWDPRWPDIKLAQAHLLCEAIADFISAQLMPGSTGRLPVPVRSRMPVLLGGDFNSLPIKTQSDQFDTVPEGAALVSGVYELLAGSGSVGPEHQDHPARRYQRRSRQAAADAGQLAQYRPSTVGLELASASVAAWGREPLVTNSTANFSGCLDYVLYSRQHWAVVGALELPYDVAEGSRAAEAGASGARLLPPLPDEHLAPSDHLPLAFRLLLLPEQ